MVRNALKCIDCRRDKQKCTPKIRRWEDSGAQEKCERCFRLGHQCSASEHSRRQTTQVRPADVGSMASAGQKGVELRIVETKDANVANDNRLEMQHRLREQLKKGLQEFDIVGKLFKEVQILVESLAVRQDQLHVGDPYKILPEHEKLLRFQNAMIPGLYAKLAIIGLLAEQLAQSGDADAAEKAFLRAVQGYRSLAFNSSPAYWELLGKVANFYFENDYRIQGEEYLGELLQRPDIPGSGQDAAWRQMARSLDISSEELKTAFLSIATGDERELDVSTPFPSLHRMMRIGHNRAIPEDLIEMDMVVDVDITSSPPIHHAITAGLGCVSDMIRRCDDFELGRRDVYDRTLLILAALFKHEVAGEALLERFSNLPSSARKLRMDEQDYLGWTALAIAILSGCSFPFIELLIANGAEVNPLIYESAYTPLQAAAWRGRLDVLLFLLERGANPDDADPDHLTPAQLAERGGHLNIVEALQIHSNSIQE